MKTSSNTPSRHITTCHVQFNGVLVQQRYRKNKIRPVCTCFPHTEIPFTQWKCHIEAVYFIKQYFYQKFTCELVFIAKTFSCSCHICLLGYTLSQHVRFHKLPVSFVR
jgi:hypothetical protein